MKGLRLLQNIGAINLPASILGELEGDSPHRGLDLHYVISPRLNHDQPRMGSESETNENDTSRDRAHPRSARSVIDQIAGANYRLERLLYSVALLSLVGAVAAVIFLASDKRPYVATMAVLPVLVFWSTLNSARRVHSENMLIRLLEIALQNLHKYRGGARTNGAFGRLEIEYPSCDSRACLGCRKFTFNRTNTPEGRAART